MLPGLLEPTLDIDKRSEIEFRLRAVDREEASGQPHDGPCLHGIVADEDAQDASLVLLMESSLCRRREKAGRPFLLFSHGLHINDGLVDDVAFREKGAHQHVQKLVLMHLKDDKDSVSEVRLRVDQGAFAGRCEFVVRLPWKEFQHPLNDVALACRRRTFNRCRNGLWE